MADHGSPPPELAEHQHNEARFHSLILRHVSDAVISIDNAGAITFMNRAAERQYNVRAEDALGQPLQALYEYHWVDPQDETRATEALARDGFWRGENVHVLRDGTVLRVESTVSVLTDGSGHGVGLLAVIRDVTSARHLEEALREREERMRRVLAIETVGVLFFTLSGRITDANAAFEKMSGYTCEELTRIDHWQLLTDREFHDATVKAAGELATRGETQAYEKQMVRKDGSRWWGLFAPKRLGEDGECVEFILDITARKEAEAALRHVELRRRMALDAAELGTWTHDLRSGQVELDARAAAHYGVDAPVVRIEEVLARVHPDDAPGLGRAMAAAVDPAVKQPVAAEYRVVRPEGGIRWLSINGQVEFQPVDGGEQAVLGVGTTRDVTEQKRVEETLREADRRKDEFLAILAHELRNPLAPIRTAVGIMRAPNVPDQLLRRSRDIIDRQVAQMARLVDDLLDVSRLSRGQVSLQRRLVRLDEVLDLAIETARPLIEERGHQLTERRAPHPVLVEADVARLSQVFANLLNNAAKYTPPGGSITIDVREEEGDVEVRVSDTGEGIAPGHLESIFELFAQGAGTSTPGAGGLGIGLALARRLVELHDGSLSAQSPGVGMGATFIVRLPRRASEIVDESAARDERAASGRSRRVLVVDDNVDAADMTAMLLETSGCVVRRAYGGEEALREVAAFRPEIVLLDIGMPGMDGLETCRRIRELPGGAAIFVAAVTGWGQEENRRLTQSAGFDVHLVKPIAADALLGLIENVPKPGEAG